MADPRLRGTDVSIRVLQDARIIQAIDSISTFNDSTKFEIKEDGFLGEVTNRHDTVLNGYAGTFDFQVHDAAWMNFELAIERKAKRVALVVFNVVRTDFFANGSNAIVTYKDVAWGEFGKTNAGRAEYFKITAPFATGDRDVQINQIG